MKKQHPRKKNLFFRIRAILEAARAGVARSVNTTQVISNWLIGREIVEEEQRGERRANYGERLLLGLAQELSAANEKGYSLPNLKLMRQFYLSYPALLVVSGKGYATRSLSYKQQNSPKSYAVRSQFKNLLSSELYLSWTTGLADESWEPGRLHPNLSWTQYRILLRVAKSEARAFYEIEAIQNNWTSRELERQINSLLYERLALSNDKKGLLRLAEQGQEIAGPLDVFKDPMVIEFLGLPESSRLVESKLEEALVDNLQQFLLELGKGFAFVSRQERITLGGDHFYIDLVFYHAVLKCYVLIDLKVGKLTHEDIGQLQLYVNYYDQERSTAGDNPTLGLILCTDKNDAVVKYTLGSRQEPKIFASRYKLHLPSESELSAEIRRELRLLASNTQGVAPKNFHKPQKKRRKSEE